MYLDKVGQLRGHQAVELVFAQSAGGSIFPSVHLELANEGADGGFHDTETIKLNEYRKEILSKAAKSKLEIVLKAVAVVSPVEMFCVAGTKSCVPML